jgi:hypothetical protein
MPAPWERSSPQLKQYLLIVHQTSWWPRSALCPSSSGTESKNSRHPLCGCGSVRHLGPFSLAADSPVNAPDPTALATSELLDGLATFGLPASLVVPHPRPLALRIAPCELIPAASPSLGLDVTALDFPKSTSRPLKSTIRTFHAGFYVSPANPATRPAPDRAFRPSQSDGR